MYGYIKMIIFRVKFVIFGWVITIHQFLCEAKHANFLKTSGLIRMVSN